MRQVGLPGWGKRTGLPNGGCLSFLLEPLLLGGPEDWFAWDGLLGI